MIERDSVGRVTEDERQRLLADAEILRRAAEVFRRRDWDGDGEVASCESWAAFAEDMASPPASKP